MLMQPTILNINYKTKFAYKNNLSFRATSPENAPIDFSSKLFANELYQKVVEHQYDLSKVDKDGNNILHILSREEAYSLLRNLLLILDNKNINDLFAMKNNNGQTPIDLIKSEDVKIYILENLGNNANASTEDGKEDARIILAKQTVANTKKEANNNQEVSFFEGIEEVGDEEDASFNKSLDQVSKENIESSKIICDDSENLDFLRDYNLLEIYSDEPSSFEGIIGNEDLKRELKGSIINPLTNAQALDSLKKNNIKLPNGILFVANANALTMVKALANEAKLPAIVLDNPGQISGVKKAVNNRYQATGLRTMILVDGFDKFFENQDSIVLNNFKNVIKTLERNGGLFVAIANDKNNINCDFLESSIIDKVFDIKNPTLDDRKEYFSRFIEGKDVFSDLRNDESIQRFAELTDNLTYSDLKRVLNNSATFAISNKTKVNEEILNNSLQTFSAETGRVPIDELNKTSAYDTENFKRIPLEPGEMMSLDELGGMPDVKARLRELYVEPMKNIEDLQTIFGNDAIPDGAIFYGAPGNGKTLTARVLARELGLPYYETRLSDFGTALVHESGKAFKNYASQLDKKFKETGERSVWFLDEFDGLGSNRNDTHNHTDRELVNTLLQELTNPAERGYILIAATNNLEDVDSALKRRGRLGNWIEFKNPNQEERKDTIGKILAKHEFTKEFANDNELVGKIAKELDGFSMSSIANILKDAKRDFYLNKTDFSDSITKALDENAKREMGEFCGKTGLKKHEYETWSFKSLDELAGMDDVIATLRDTVIGAWDPEVRQMMLACNRVPSGGFILEGPPGTGKTTLIETLAREMNVPLFKMNYNQEGNQYIHQTSKHINEIFERLSLESKIIKKPVMILFDEAEKFFPRNADGHQIEEVNTYKDLMNNASAKGIILAGATNHIDLVNQEIIGNPRRMGNVIHCGEPSNDGVKNLIVKLFKNLPILDKDLDDESIEAIVGLASGLTIGAIADIADKIIMQTIKKKENLNSEKIIEGFKLLSNKIAK